MPGRVGFIGLGNMGQAMALNLVKRGFQVIGHDIDPARAEPLRTSGANVANSSEAVAAASDRTVCMVETTEQAEMVIAGDHGVIAGAKPGHVVISMSTIDPFVARRLGERLGAHGIAMLDAPVSGGRARALSGELSIVVGGARDTFGACEDVLRAMGTSVFHVGALGQGLAVKLIHNMLMHVNMVAIAEALVVGAKAGLDPWTIYDVVRVSAGTSRAFETKVPKILERDFSSLGAALDVAYKDQELGTQFAKRLGVPVLLANVSQQVYQMARAAGLGKQDTHAIIRVPEQLAGVEVRGERRPQQ